MDGMNRVALLAALLLSAHASPQAKLNVIAGTSRIGTASVIQKLMPDGNKSVELRMDLESQGRKVTLRAQSTFDPKGNPIRKFQEMAVPGQTGKRQTVATFDAEGANVVILDNGVRTVRQVALVKTANRANRAEFWFLRDKPKAGDSVKAFEFNLDSLEWELTTTTYVGPRVVKLGARRIQTHELRVQRGARALTTFVDDAGLPVILDDGRVKLERLPPSG